MITLVARTRRQRVAAPQPNRGFTLIEVLVVVVLIAIIVSLVSVKLQRDDRQILREEAVRLAALLTHAKDEAIVTGAGVGWNADREGYRFLRRDPTSGWRPLVGDDVLRARSLAGAIRVVAVEIDRRAAPPDHVLYLSPTGFSAPFRVTLELNGTRMAVQADGFSEILVEDIRG